jgi:hypothetical protein
MSSHEPTAIFKTFTIQRIYKINGATEKIFILGTL